MASNITRYDDPDQIVWDEPPADTVSKGSTARFDRYAAELEAHQNQPALYRQGGKGYFSLSDSQRRRHPRLRVINKRVEDDTVTTWLVFDPDYVPEVRTKRAKQAEQAEQAEAPSVDESTGPVENFDAPDLDSIGG